MGNDCLFTCCKDSNVPTIGHQQNNSQNVSVIKQQPSNFISYDPKDNSSHQYSGNESRNFQLPTKDTWDRKKRKDKERQRDEERRREDLEHERTMQAMKEGYERQLNEINRQGQMQAISHKTQMAQLQRDGQVFVS
ncbi:hypothetical protein WR25_02792 [Diploscapter pachys]|uniref:Uncharacterized protein n=1 Tax=Diploscapter pachys TaxID=2018661 RepID=A0A2A2LAS0_9BILA|nr:hypothetical protein WR25_02792 [Diploscapter pachys]